MTRKVQMIKDDWELRIDLTKSVEGDIGITDWWYEDLKNRMYPETLSLCNTTMAELFAIPGKCRDITAVLSNKLHPQSYPLRIVKDSPSILGVTVMLAYKKRPKLHLSFYDIVMQKRVGAQTKNLAPGGGWWSPVICMTSQKQLLHYQLEIGEVAYFRVEIDE